MDYLKNMDYADIKKIQKSAIDLIKLLDKFELKIKYDFDSIVDDEKWTGQLEHNLIIKDSKDEILFENTWIE